MNLFHFPQSLPASRPAWLLAVPMLCLLPAHRSAAEAGLPAVRVTRDVAYYQGKDADPVRHTLDLFLPQATRDYPVIVLIHGGAWMFGDKTLFGWGADIAEFFARQGIGVVLPNYRLAPGVKYAEQARDVARALAWTQRNIARYGGSPERMFLCGHSAGGHLVALVASDADYLKAEDVKLSPIKGVISVSGVYDIPALDLNLSLPQGWADAVTRLPSIMGKGDGDKKAAKPEGMAAGPWFSLNPFSPVFGDDPKVRRGASPLNHVRAGLPPFLLVYADHDLPLLSGMARQFAKALKDERCDVQTLEVAHRDHESVMFSATAADDPVARAMLKFIRGHLTEREKK